MLSASEYLKIATENKASDVFIIAGGPVNMKVRGIMQPINDEKIMPAASADLIGQIYALAKRPMDIYMQKGDDDFSFAMAGLARFRVNTYKQRGSEAAIIRIVAFTIPSKEEMSIPAEVMRIASLEHGMVLFTGTAGSGKSTTQACIINEINHTRSGHIITLEDPIEYLYRNEKCMISQREISIDTEDYLSALRACLRQAPDVILLGEMRDISTIGTAVTAAETGHLLLATLHTKGTVNAIDRIIDTFPGSQQAQIRVQLSSVLQTVVSQQLLPSVDGGRVPAYEVMNVNTAIKNMIRESKTHQIDNAIAAGGADGMISMDQSIANLVQQGRITKETALEYADNPDQMTRRLAR